MASSLATQSHILKAGVPIEFNFGLHGLGTTPVQLASAYIQRLRGNDIAEVPFYAYIQPKVNEHDEGTLIVSCVLTEVGANSTALWELLHDARQDCIAVYYPDDGIGYLYGPNADAWGLFNRALFKRIPEGAIDGS